MAIYASLGILADKGGASSGGGVEKIKAGDTTYQPDSGGVITLGSSAELDAQETVFDIDANKLMRTGAGGVLANGSYPVAAHTQFFTNESSALGFTGPSAGISLVITPTQKMQLGIDSTGKVFSRISKIPNPDDAATQWNAIGGSNLVVTPEENFVASGATYIPVVQGVFNETASIYVSGQTFTVDLKNIFLMTGGIYLANPRYSLRLDISGSIGGFTLKLATPTTRLMYWIDGTKVNSASLSVLEGQQIIFEVEFIQSWGIAVVRKTFDSMGVVTGAVPALGAPGCLAMCMYTKNGAAVPGAKIAGSALHYAGAMGTEARSTTLYYVPSPALPGTWQLNGTTEVDTSLPDPGNSSVSVFVRIDGVGTLSASHLLLAANGTGSVRNCHYANAEHSLIDCEVLYREQWIPFTASPDDEAHWGPLIYQHALSGKYGDIAGFSNPAIP